PAYKDQGDGEPKQKKEANPEKKNATKAPAGAEADSDWWRFSENRPGCKTTYFSIAGQDPPNAVLQLIKAELQKENITLTETNANVFTFSTTAEKWKEAHWKLEEALENRDLQMIEGPPQILQLAIDHVHLFWNFHDVGCTLNLQVRNLQEQVRNFKSTNISPELYVSCNWALSKAVAQMFVDPAVLRDSDGDGVPDHKDECPNTPKGVKVDEKGCPLDTDGDGVPDYMDECPDTPRGIEVDAKGCPFDSDGDGVPDYLDECPNTPKGAKVDEKGCPLDTDGDGVPDYLDECPGTPKGAKVDERGCWVISKALFDFNKYQIKTAFYPHLDEIVMVLKQNPDMVVEIQGHTDNVGSEAYNRKLSENRAKAVKNYLIRKGINDQRLIAVGFGKSRPKTTNRTEEGRALNRRVELLPIQ
ncbi:MAG: OmpA family protein, partial [Deltaproteobacteria bacterium]|nr:OmpA family protein [Deltaproteobacteria bacterium]